jgi:hypothetical protein
VPAIVRESGETADPLALADALLRAAETASDPTPLIAAARALVEAAQAQPRARARTGQETGQPRGDKATG